MDIERSKYLLERFHKNSLTDEEHLEFEELLYSPEYSLFRDLWLKEYWDSGNQITNHQALRQQSVLDQILETRETSKKRYFSRYSVSIVVIAMLLTGGAIFGLRYLFPGFQTENDIGPGGNIASLVMADGKTLALSNAHTNLILSDHWHYADGTVITEAPSDKDQKIKIIVPIGGTYCVTLSDGSQVWLNSDSKLIFPARFGNEKREVFLEGEAFFKVAKSTIQMGNKSVEVPFEVKTGKQTIQVLGTQFNLLAYPDSPETTTTLIEGKVKILQGEIHQKGSKMVFLEPGQKALSSAKQLKVEKVDPSQSMAWKEGYFDFTDKDLNQVMLELARWYGLEVHYQGNIPKMYFYGSIERNNQLSTVLTLLETNGLAYLLEGKKITIFLNKKEGGLSRS